MDQTIPTYLALALVAAGAAIMAVNVVRFGVIRRFARENITRDYDKLGPYIALHQGLMILVLLCYAAVLAVWLLRVPAIEGLIVGALAFMAAAMAFNGARLQHKLMDSLKQGYRNMVSMYSSLEDGKERMGQLGERLDRERSQRRRFEEADRLKSVFLTDASSQIREPMASLLEHAQRIRDLIHGDAQGDHGEDVTPEALLDEMTWRMEAVLRDGRRVDRMCRDMHSLASDVDRHIMDAEQVVSLADILRQSAREMAKALAERGGVDFSSDIQDSLPALRMDAKLLGRMVRSLVDHVVRGASQGTVHLASAVRADGRIRISVRNLGAQHMTVGELEEAQTGGRGNDGLSECRLDASRFGGRVWSEVDSDAGSVVYLEFPASLRANPA